MIILAGVLRSARHRAALPDGTQLGGAVTKEVAGGVENQLVVGVAEACTHVANSTMGDHVAGVAAVPGLLDELELR